MQHHFTYDELTPLEQCIASFVAGTYWGRENLPTYAEDVPMRKEKPSKTARTN